MGADYTTWEGFTNPETGETKIGLSYDKLCQTMKPGSRILIADGTLAIEVLEILNDKEVGGLPEHVGHPPHACAYRCTSILFPPPGPLYRGHLSDRYHIALHVP